MKLIIIIVGLSTLVLCTRIEKSNLKTIYDFQTIRTEYLKFTEPIEQTEMGHCKLFITDNDSILVIPLLGEKKVMLFSLQNKKLIKSFDISFVSPKYLFAVEPISTDSFLLAYSFNGNSFNTNLNNKILYSLKITNDTFATNVIPLPEYKFFNYDTASFIENTFLYPSFSQKFFHINDTLILIPLKRLSNTTIGSISFVEKHFSVLTLLNNRTKTLKEINFFDYPYIKQNVFYPSDISPYYICLSDNHIYIRYFYSGDIFICNINGNYVGKKRLTSMLVDTIMPAKKPIVTHLSDVTFEAFYTHINFDPYRNLFYSFVYFPNTRYGEPYFSLIIADKEFNYVNEYFNQFKFGINTIFTEDYILNLSVKNNQLQVNYLKPLKKTIPIKTYNDSIFSWRNFLKQKEEKTNNELCQILNIKNNQKILNILDYANKIQKINDSVFCSIYISSYMCHSCIDNVLFHFMINKQNYKNIPIYLNYSGDKEEVIKKLNKYNLLNYNKLHIDSANIYTKFHHFNDLFIRMILVLNKNTIYSDTIYPPDKLNEMFEKCFSFISKHYTVKH